jgi:YD repeat-containing protein
MPAEQIRNGTIGRKTTDSEYETLGSGRAGRPDAWGTTSDRRPCHPTRTDPLQRMASYQYDANHHLTQATDRKGQITTYQYDALDRRSHITYADTSTIDYLRCGGPPHADRRLAQRDDHADV